MLRKGLIAASSVGAVTLGLSGVVLAAPPIGVSFNQWSVDSGDVTAACPAGYTCSGAVSDKGFYQDVITSGDGDRFFRTIVTEQSVTGTPGTYDLGFSDENYVSMGNTNGISDRSYIADSVSVDLVDPIEGAHVYTSNFYTVATVDTGWATGGDPDKINIYQGVSALDTVFEDFRTDFTLDQRGVNGQDGKEMVITGTVEIEADGSSSQVFALVEKSGSYTTVGGSITDLGGTASNDLSWTPGQDVQAVWVGQNLTLANLPEQEFGFVSYENKTTSSFISDFDFMTAGASSAPEQWDPGFWGPYQPPVVTDPLAP